MANFIKKSIKKDERPVAPRVLVVRYEDGSSAKFKIKPFKSLKTKDISLDNLYQITTDGYK